MSRNAPPPSRRWLRLVVEQRRKAFIWDQVVRYGVIGVCLLASSCQLLSGGSKLQVDGGGGMAGGGGARPCSFEASSETPGVMVIEAESFHANIVKSEIAWVFGMELTPPSGTDYMTTANEDVFIMMAMATEKSPELNYRVRFASSANYTLWARGYKVDGKSDTIWVGLNGALNEELISGESLPANEWYWDEVSLGAIAAGELLFQLWMREDGSNIDRFVITSQPGWDPNQNNGDTLAESPCIEEAS